MSSSALLSLLTKTSPRYGGALISLMLVSGVLRAEQIAGYRNDSTGIFTDAKPPTTCSYPNDRRWETALPSWGHGCPIVVGDQIFLMVEPSVSCIWPQLVSLDLATGKELWRKPVSTAEAMFPQDTTRQKALESAWQKHRDFLTRYYRWIYRHQVAVDKAPVEEAMAKDGFEYGQTKRGMAVLPKGGKESPVLREIITELKAFDLTRDDWNEGKFGFNGLWCIGQAYPTPVSDGQRIYVATAQDVFAAFDLTGKQLWLTRVPGNTRAGDYCYKGRSPIIWKGLLISDLSNKVRAFDSATGKLLWSDDGPLKVDPKEGAQTMVSPGVLTVDGKDVLLAAGCSAYLLPEGKQVSVEGWSNYGMQLLVKHDERDVAFFCGAGEHCGWENKGNCATPPPAAIRFAWNDGKLMAKVLWSGINGKMWGGNRPWMLYDGGKLFCPSNGAVDAMTGKTVFGSFDKELRFGALGAVPWTAHLLQQANGHVYGLDRTYDSKGGAVLQICTLDGKGVTSMAIPQPTERTEDVENLAATGWLLHTKDKDKFAYSYAFTFGPDCIIIRGMARLYCIGK